jgi:hypothetical protein
MYLKYIVHGFHTLGATELHNIILTFSIKYW